MRDWQEARVWGRLHQELLQRLHEAQHIDWGRACVDSASIPTKSHAIGPDPTDIDKAGTKRHLLTDRNGLPLAFLLKQNVPADDKRVVLLILICFISFFITIRDLTTVASRTIIRTLVEQMRLGSVPLFDGLHGRFALEGGLW